MNRAVAREIHDRFWRKMRPGGEIDQILNGGEPGQKRPPARDDEIALIKRQIEIQIDEYEQAIRDAVNWYVAWKMRQRRRGFRCVQGKIVCRD